MPVFQDSDAFYTVMATLFTELEQEDAVVEALLKTGLTIGFRCQAPSAALSIDARQRPVTTSFGADALRPQLTIELNADTFHAILLGRLTLKQALGQQKLRARGPVWKTMALAPLFERAQALYPTILAERVD